LTDAPGGAVRLACTVIRFLVLPVLLAALVAAPATATAAAPGKPRATKQRCPPGTTPLVRKQGKRAVPKRDRKGRLRCKALKAGKPPAPSASPIGQAASVTDALRDARATNPRALARLERAIGRKRAKRLLAITLDGWERGATAARAARAAPEQTTTFTPSNGVQGSVTFGVEQATGADSGFTATASASVSASRDGVAKLSPSLADKLPPDVTGAKGEVSVRFEDKVAACPSAKGGRQGSVKASGRVKVTVERDGKPPIEVELAADVAATYIAQDGRLDDVDVQTTFRTAATGESTQTYRGRRLGTGFGRESILDASDTSSAIERDVAHFDVDAGGVFGPKGGWNYARGISVSDLRSIDNVKAMLATAVATNLLTLAALEYARKVALPRAEREGCGYTVAINVAGQGIFGTHDASGTFAVSAVAAQTGPGTWHAAVPAGWTALSFTSKIGCPYVDPTSGGAFTADLALTEAGRLRVTWSTDQGAGMSSATVDCPPEGEPPTDPPPIPGQPGPALLGIAPMQFELPPEGGSQALSGGVQDGGNGWFNDGAFTVVRTR
jgi:hypothetical protein